MAVFAPLGARKWGVFPWGVEGVEIDRKPFGALRPKLKQVTLTVPLYGWLK